MKIFSLFLSITLAAGVFFPNLAVSMPRPELDLLKLIDEQKAPVKDSLARVEVLTGDVRLALEDEIVSYRADFGSQIGHGDILFAAEESRCRVVLRNSSHILHIAGPAILVFKEEEEQITVRLFQGQLIWYSIPVITGREIVHLDTDSGRLDMESGVAALTIDLEYNPDSIMVLENNAAWMPNPDREIILSKGLKLQDIESNHTPAFLEEKEKNELINNMDLEQIINRTGTEQLVAEDYINAFTTFSELQTSFPFNENAAYCLGLIALKDNKLATAIKQWRKYTELDPLGAKKRDIPKQLMVMKMKQIKVEVQNALEEEKHGLTGKADPNTVAVFPFINNGNKKYSVMGKGIAAMVIADLAKVPGLKVLDRIKIQKLISEISMEQKLAASGLMENDSKLQSGKILKAGKVVIGSYTVE
jgi:hypothetical protein